MVLIGTMLEPNKQQSNGPKKTVCVLSQWIDGLFLLLLLLQTTPSTMNHHRTVRTLVSLLLCFSPTWAQRTTTSTSTLDDRTVQVINQSGQQVSVEWVHPVSGQTIPMGKATHHGHQVTLNTFVNHTFVVVPSHTNYDTEKQPELPVPTSNHASSPPQEQHQVTITISPETSRHQVFVLRQGMVLEEQQEEASSSPLHTKTVHDRVIRDCQAQALEALSKNQKHNDATQQQDLIHHLSACLTRHTANLLVEANDALQQEQRLRLDLSQATENYTCTDPHRATSPPIAVETWTNQNELATNFSQDHVVHVLHRRASSQIHLVHNFISPAECQAIQQKRPLKPCIAAPWPTVREEVACRTIAKPGRRGLTPHWQLLDPIAIVSHRILSYTNHATGYNLSHEGQEDLMSIQYFGHGTADPTPDRYMPHCDGECSGRPHKTGGRVATMVLYCDAPTLGGGTNFQNAGVLVQPTVGAAAFFSYYNPTTQLMETGFTSHSGCPVWEGTKRIAVQWMRMGVNAENPWDSFDTNTMKLESSQRRRRQQPTQSTPQQEPQQRASEEETCHDEA